MCRFLLVRSKRTLTKQHIKHYLHEFAQVCRASRTQEGDRQEDGWGVSWLNTKNQWQRYRSLEPIWRDQDRFSMIPSTQILVVHARSASFEKHKGILSYNQPYIHNRTCFVFNGVLHGVSIPQKLPGTIGAQKIHALLIEYLKHHDPKTSLEKLHAYLLSHCKTSIGLNIGLVQKNSIYALYGENTNPEYYGLYATNISDHAIICSEPLPSYSMRPLSQGAIVSL